jgi:hypothetical protein
MGKVTVVLEKLTNLKDGTLLMLLWWQAAVGRRRRARMVLTSDDDDDGGSSAVRVRVLSDLVPPPTHP